MNPGKILALGCLAIGVLFYVAAVAGLMWPATPPMDVGVVSTSGVFILLGLLGLLLKDRPAQS